jgi:cytochrome b6-f complex iron-sulfur subunit
MDRREFMSWVGVGLVASSLPMAIAACTDTNPQSTQTPEDQIATRPDGFAEVGTVAQLDEQKFIKDTTMNPPILVVRDPQQANQVLAVSAKCTHQGCDLVWDGAGSMFSCPCHNSLFDVNGQVKKGPASQPLKTLAAKIEGESVLLKV